ncbi:Prolyl-tRNA editing enzyme YbaK/EbsC (Cys-tRNA(Pro) deacylase) OS=Castellaniella defragrans OX=75697 GN=HNR28_000648 PE=4 SV=1 [Castellaniella defragrans]
MTIESVRQFFAEHAPDIQILELGQSTATVELAARAHHVAPGQIAKTLSLRTGDRVVLVVACGDTRLDNKKLRHVLGGRPKMLAEDEVTELTGHPVGGVCPFGLIQPLPVYCDIRLHNYAVVMPAAGSLDSAVCITPARLSELTLGQWVDVCQDAPAAVQSEGGPAV